MSVVSTRSTATYTLPAGSIVPVGLVTEEDLAVIEDLTWTDDCKGFFTRGEYSINFHATDDCLTIGYAKRGRHALV